MVEVTGFEPAASCSQSRRATNCATPGYLVFSELPRVFPNRAFYQLNYTRIFSFCYYTTEKAKIKDFPVCGQSCGQSRFLPCVGDHAKSRKCPCCKAFRASAVPVVDGVHSTPKAGALPTAQHPDMIFSFELLYHAPGENQRFSCLWSIMWSGPLSGPFS